MEIRKQDEINSSQQKESLDTNVPSSRPSLTELTEKDMSALQGGSKSWTSIFQNRPTNLDGALSF